MGKYIRKTKPELPPAAMESSLGVRTRATARSLFPSSPNYLQLRSRRLLKLPIAFSSRQPQHTRRASFLKAVAAAEMVTADELECREESAADNEVKGWGSFDLSGAGEASFGDSVTAFEVRERATRESTPCSLIRDPDVVRSPGSTSRPSSALTRRASNTEHGHIPTSNEMDQFFAGAEQEQHRSFIEKYNFDPANEMPLPGRYEWEKLKTSREKKANKVFSKEG